jgi:hypothetical protein
MDIQNIIYKLLTSEKSNWILKIESEDTDSNEQTLTIYKIQHWLLANKQTRTHARFLEQHMNNITRHDLKKYLALAWSIVFFDGKKLKKETQVRV